MTEPWTDEIDQLRARLGVLIKRSDLGADAQELASEALEELAVVVEELQAQNSELITSRVDLEEERERYRDLFQTVPDGYVVTDSHGMLREVNETAADLFGKPRRQLIGKALGSLIEPQDRRAFYTQLSRIHSEGPGARLSINLSVHDHITLPANLRATVATSRTDGDPEIRWLIHDRRPDIASRRLRTSEERLRTLFDTAPVGIMLTDRDGSIVFTNQYAEHLLERRPAAVQLDAWLETIHGDDRQQVRAALDIARRHGRSTTVRHRIGNGEELRWVDHGISPFPDPDDGPTGTISTITDVTAEHQARTHLEAARDLTDAILDTVGALVIVLDPDGRIERFNAACEATTGRSADSVIGRHFLDVLIPDDQRDDVDLVFAHLINEGLFASYENDWVTANGDRRTISWTNTTLRNPDGTIRAIVGTGLDITETLLLQQRLAQADRLESIGRLAAGIAHDFNNTLSTLRLRLDRLARRLTDPDNREDIDAANTTIDRTQHIIADLVSFSRQQQLHPQPTDINAEVQRLTTMLADLLGDTITTRLHLTDRPAIAHIDPGRIEQALTNLLLNARDAMPDGGTITVTTSIDRIDADNAPTGSRLTPGDYVRVSVTDTGTGIDPDNTPHIFDPYFTTKPPAEGTGLGLATTHGTITQTGGAIEAASTPGEGTTLTFWLPRDTTTDADADTDTRPRAHRGTQADIILVVEDDAGMRDVLIDELRQLDYETLTADSGEQALRFLDTDIDILITDIQLPNMNGVELAARFRHHAPEITLLYISGATPAVLQALLPEDATILAKPFTTSQLVDAIALAHRAPKGTGE